MYKFSSARGMLCTTTVIDQFDCISYNPLLSLSALVGYAAWVIQSGDGPLSMH